MPVCNILAGANGSGKSSIYRELNLPGQFINADVVARHLAPQNPALASVKAGRIVLEQLRHCISTGGDFVYETTLSSRQSIALMAQARAAGYEVGLVFVALRGVHLNVQRVAQRVALGGHDIPEPVIRRRYQKSFAQLPEALTIAHRSMIYDNSAFSRSELLLQIEGGAIHTNQLRPDDSFHRRIATIIAGAIALPLDAIIVRFE